jgi:hypothetical protein
MPPDVAGEILMHLQWDRGASAVFRKTCKGWRDAHDQNVIRLSVLRASLPWSYVLRTRFPGVIEIRVRGDTHLNPSFAPTFYDDDWSRTFDGLTALTDLNLSECRNFTDGGLHSLAGLVALTSLDLQGCDQVSDDGYQALAALTALEEIHASTPDGGDGASIAEAAPGTQPRHHRPHC